MIVYSSRTGNVLKIVQKLGYPYQSVEQPVDEPFVIFTYTDGNGAVPSEVDDFMERYHHLCKGVLVSGNRNWGSRFAFAGDRLAMEYHIPLGTKFDLLGVDTDYEKSKIFYERVMQK